MHYQVKLWFRLYFLLCLKLFAPAHTYENRGEEDTGSKFGGVRISMNSAAFHLSFLLLVFYSSTQKLCLALFIHSSMEKQASCLKS